MPAASPSVPQEQPFEIRRSPIQGRGAFATRRIEKGERIIEYTGEIISVEESDRRYDDESMSRHHTFLFSLDNGYVIDGAVGGNDSRFINHSCAPNCEAVDVKGRIWVEALRNIEPGEELAYDYAYEREGFEDEKWEKLYVCHCGAPTCRGTILAPLEKKKATKKKRAATGKKRSRRTTSKADTHSAARHATEKRGGTKRSAAKRTGAKGTGAKRTGIKRSASTRTKGRTGTTSRGRTRA